MKLTDPQRELLRDLGSRGTQRVVSNYKPAAALAKQGLAEIIVVEGAYAWRVALTDAGRAALKEATDRG